MSIEKPKPKENIQAITVGELLKQLQENPELQQQCFGKTFTEEEFTERFGGGINVDEVKKLAMAAGFEVPDAATVEKWIKEGVAKVDTKEYIAPVHVPFIKKEDN